MTLLNKRYCSHCGTPNPREVQTCAKCSKPLNSALKAALEDDVVIVKKRPTSKARVVYEDDEDSFSGDIIQPSSNDVVIERAPRITVASLKNGASLPSFGQGDSLPADIEVSSKSYFHKENLD